MMTRKISRTIPKLKIYYEDDDIIVVHKDAFISAQATRGGEIDLESMIKKHLHSKDRKTNPYVAVVHRLDKPVEGVMVYAKTKAAAGNLSAQIQNKHFKKTYLAVVTGNPDNETYERVENYLVKDSRTNMSVVVDKSHKDSKIGILEYRRIGLNREGNAILEVKLHTGRHHQIRVTLAHIGYPIVGDRKYGRLEEGSDLDSNKGGLQLHAYKLEFNHPVSKNRMEFISEINDIYKIIR